MMLDGVVINVVMTEIETQLSAYGLDDYHVTRGNQPTQQFAGAHGSAAKYQVFVTPISQQDIGHSRSYSDSEETKTITHNKAKTIQIETLVDFDPSDTSEMPATDLCEIIRDMLQHPDAIDTMRESGVKLEHCTEMRPTIMINQSERFEMAPSFDLRVTYANQYTKSAPSVSEVQSTITEGV